MAAHDDKASESPVAWVSLGSESLLTSGPGQKRRSFSRARIAAGFDLSRDIMQICKRLSQEVIDLGYLENQISVLEGTAGQGCRNSCMT
jgi:hypothetical protein